MSAGYALWRLDPTRRVGTFVGDLNSVYLRRLCFGVQCTLEIGSSVSGYFGYGGIRMRFDWDRQKGEELILKGRPSFEDALDALANGYLILEGENPGYPGQRIFVVKINGYPHVIPYEIRSGVFWLITVFPARKYKK
jgi:hypothetical protein